MICDIGDAWTTMEERKKGLSDGRRCSIQDDHTPFGDSRGIYFYGFYVMRGRRAILGGWKNMELRDGCAVRKAALSKTSLQIDSFWKNKTHTQKTQRYDLEYVPG